MPIIFITGYGDVPMTVQAMKAGAVEFLMKPFSDEILLSAIRQAIERSRGRARSGERGEGAARALRLAQHSAGASRRSWHWSLPAS
jgi:FixJ family two-component response regulator